MPVVRMPDGTNVSFPDDMPKEQIRGLIASKFPDSIPQHTAVPQPSPVQEDISKAESLVRGTGYGALQQPRDVLAAGVANIFGDVPFKEGLEQADQMSLEGRQGEAQQANPLSFTGGQVLGNVASTLVPSAAATKAVGAVAPALESLPVAGKALSSLASNIGASRGLLGIPAAGAIQGAVSSGMTEGNLSGALPGAIGAGAVGALGKIAKPIADDAISGVKKGYNSVLEKVGITDLTPGQLTGNPFLETMDSVFANLPFTAGAARKKAEGQLGKFTKSALKTAGISEDLATPSTLAKAESEFGKRYNEIMKDEIVNIDSQAINEISNVVSNQLDKLPTNTKSIVNSYLKDIIQAKDRKLSGSAYQVARSNLSKQAKSMTNTDSYTASVLRSIRETLDGAAERSLPLDKKGAWGQLNREYANYKTIQDAASRVSKDSLEGYLSPAALLQSAMRANPSKGQRGYGDLYNLSRAGRATLTDSIPNSGTAQRQLVQSMLTGGGLGLGAGGTAYGATQDPSTAGLAALAAIGGPRVVQSLINSPAAGKYLTSGIPIANQLANPQASALGALISSSAFKE